MNNEQIAEIFFRIADALEIRGDNVFKIRAYRTAARNISELARQLSDLYAGDPGSLDGIEGIGKDLKAKIIEMLGTGGLAYYDELMSEFEPGFLDLLNLSGLGPKKLSKLRKELGINNVDDLEKACKSGRVAELPGMGDKTEAKILESIEHYRKKQGRLLLPEAYAYAMAMIEYLEKPRGLFRKTDIAGSLRRGRETIGDIDILATVSDPEKAMEHFTGFPGVGSIVAKGATKSSVSLKGGPQIDLRVVDKNSYGAALQYFTGSKEHNVKLRHIAKNKGYKLSEYGVFKVTRNGKEVFAAGGTEREVYKELGLGFIPPEMRENRGEIEAALSGTLPSRLVELDDLKGDLHLHTNATDGTATIKELAEAAKDKGYEYIAITDHSKLIRIAKGMDEKEILAHADRIRKVARSVKGLKILAGVEVDILADGTLDLEDYALKELDLVVAAIHSNFSLDREKQTERILRCLDNPYVNILAHPSGRLISTRKGLEADMDRVFSKAAEAGVFLEINTHGERIDLNDVNSMRAKELGAGVAINTDAHSVAQMDLMFYGVVTARRGWLEKKDVLNTHGYDALIKKIRGRRS